MPLEGDPRGLDSPLGTSPSLYAPPLGGGPKLKRAGLLARLGDRAGLEVGDSLRLRLGDPVRNAVLLLERRNRDTRALSPPSLLEFLPTLCARLRARYRGRCSGAGPDEDRIKDIIFAASTSSLLFSGFTSDFASDLSRAVPVLRSSSPSSFRSFCFASTAFTPSFRLRACSWVRIDPDFMREKDLTTGSHPPQHQTGFPWDSVWIPHFSHKPEPHKKHVKSLEPT